MAATTQEACCDACAQQSGCGAYVFNSTGCELKTHCKEVFKALSADTVSGTFPVDKPAGFCASPYTGANYRCTTETLKTVPAKDVGECCEHCTNEPKCMAFTVDKKASTCDLKRSCSTKEFNPYLDSAWRPQEEPTSWRHKVGLGAFTVPGYQCGDKDGTTLIFYPRRMGQDTFKVVIYVHGMGGYLDAGPIGSQAGTSNGMDSWLQDVASTGLIVIAPFTGPQDAEGDCKTKHEDMLHALVYAKSGGVSLHPALESADWSRVGAFGHSAGASAALRVAEHGQEMGLNVVASVASHGEASVTKVHVPTLFTTGTLDGQHRNDTAMEQAFQQCASKTKVFVDLQGGFHMEPCEGKRLNFITAQFLSCHVSQQQDDCDYIYSSEGLCTRKDLHKCLTVTPQLVV